MNRRFQGETSHPWEHVTRTHTICTITAHATCWRGGAYLPPCCLNCKVSRPPCSCSCWHLRSMVQRCRETPLKSPRHVIKTLREIINWFTFKVKKTYLFSTFRRYSPCDYCHQGNNRKIKSKTSTKKAAVLMRGERLMKFSFISEFVTLPWQGWFSVTYQCDSQTPDIRADIVALSGRTWVYSFRLEHKEKPWSLTAHPQAKGKWKQ